MERLWYFRLILHCVLHDSLLLYRWVQTRLRDDEERKLAVKWPLWSEPELIVLRTDLWLTSSSLLFWAFEISDKVLSAHSSTTSSACTWCFSRSSFATNPHKDWSCISQFSLPCCLFSAATETRSERKPGSHALWVCKPGILSWLAGVFPTGTRDRKAVWSIWHFWCICPLAEAGGGAGCIKSHCTFLLFML